MRSNKAKHADPTKGNFIRALQHQKDCGVYQEHVFKVERSHADARRYCTCGEYDGSRK